MPEKTSKYELAIVGLGPRGLHALEQFLIKVCESRQTTPSIILFEETPYLGCSPVFRTDQPDTNWINITERILHLDQRPAFQLGDTHIAGFPSYHQWANITFTREDQPDKFPPRSKIGRYLQERFSSIYDALRHAECVKLIRSKVILVETKDRLVIIEDAQGNIYQVNEALLTIGHQPTRHQEDVIKWTNHQAKYDHLYFYDHPYPIAQLESLLSEPQNHRIAICGFGLAAIDVFRAVAEKLGSFSRVNGGLVFKSIYQLENFLVPFSIDGLPMAPKPLNQKNDDLYQPNPTQFNAFKDIIGDSEVQKRAENAQFLINAIAPIASEIYYSNWGNDDLTQSDIIDLTLSWLNQPDFHHELITDHSDQVKTMGSFIEMSKGEIPPGLDYCIGQVWRHCQPTIYDQLSFNDCKDSVIREIIDLDERMKRYAYGPPVESLEQILALHDAGMMNLNFLKNPDIQMNEEGWTFQKNDQELTANTLIFSVLDSPQIKTVVSPIVQNLLDNEQLEIVHDELGVCTNEHAYLRTKSDDTLPIAMLGRLAKGTVIGVDAILECFGKRPEMWAERAFENFRKNF